MSHNRDTQMYISPQERGCNETRQFADQSLRPVNDGIAQKLKKTEQQPNNSFGKQAKTELKQVDIGLKVTVPRKKGGLYRDQYRGNITLLDLEGEVNLVRKKGSSEYFSARQLHKDPSYDILAQFSKIRHENLIAIIEVFTEKDIIYVVTDKALLSLMQIVKSPPIPTAIEIGTIMGQIADGLIYLQNEGFVHGTLDCLNVFICKNGNIKLTTHKAFGKISTTAIAKDMKGVSDICMMLMQKYKLEMGKVGVENTKPWKNSEIMDFLSSTTSCGGAKELRQHPFIARIWSQESAWPNNILRGLVLTAKLTVPRNFRYSKEATPYGL